MNILINDIILKMFILYKYFIRCMCVNSYVLYTKGGKLFWNQMLLFV